MKKDAPTLITAISSTRFVCVLCLVAAFQLSACAPLVLGGAALAGKAVIDRRTAGIQIEDEAIELRSASGL